MARLPSGPGPTLLSNREAEKQEIIAWYRDALAASVPPKGLVWDPVRIGPVWDWTPERGWLLPEHSLGWECLAFAGLWLNGRGGGPWKYTLEQARIILWFYEVTFQAGFANDQYFLQRLKGWGKDPLAATITPFAMVGDTVPDWDGDRLVGREDEDAWVQLLAVSQTQTKNTMKLFPGLISADARAYFGFQIGRLNLWAMGDTRQAEAVTASPLTVEGGRPTLTILNEPQNWLESNGGHEMMGAVQGNIDKTPIDPETGLPLRAGRQLYIGNAYRPGRDSVAQRTREAWEATQGDEATHRDFGLLYDSLEAPPQAPLTLEAAPDVVRAIRGDSVWLDAEGKILNSILNSKNPPSESRRKWYNQIVAEEDDWVSPQEIDPLRDTEKILDPGDEVVVFFDGGKSDDATGAVWCRISDGHCGVVGMWQRPPAKRMGEWVAPRADIDRVIRAFLDEHNVVAFFGDPSHTRDDETLELFWDSLFDEWHSDYKHKLRLWAREGGTKAHAVLWDMSDSVNAQKFVTMVGIVTQEITTSAESGEPQFTWDGDIRLRTHMLNAKRIPTKWGLSIGKNHRESRKKVDLAVCLVGARMVRRLYLLNRKKRGGRMW